MSGIVNEHVDDLLRQAEERLQREPRISSVVPVESNSSRAERKSSLTPTSGERLTVRNPQATTVLPTTQKVSYMLQFVLGLSSSLFRDIRPLSYIGMVMRSSPSRHIDLGQISVLGYSPLKS